MSVSDDHRKTAEISGHQSPAPQPLAPGGKLKGRYLIERELGRGGIGVVYLARDERLHGMPVVIKFLLDVSGQNEWLIRKFSQEAEALTRINHPGVVRVIDRDQSDDGRPFFVMEFINGRSLREVMEPEGMALAHVARIVRQIGRALDAAHRQGVFHRDLKPENIMLEQLSGGEEQVKLIDFGIAKITNPQVGAETEVAVVAGSQQYIAPEQLLSQMVSAATDVYALAIVVYEMVTGRRPFNPQAPTPFLVMQQLMQLQQTESFVRPQTFRPELPAAAQLLMLSALSFDPARRPQDARIFAEDLAQALVGQIEVAGQRPTVAVPAPEPPTREPAMGPGAATLRVTQVKTAEASNPATAAKASPAPPASSPASIGTEPKRKGRRLPIIVGLVIVAVIAAGAIAVSLWPSAEPDSKPAGSQTSNPPAMEPQRLLNYSITMQKDPRRYPGSQPFQLPGEVVFSPGDRVRVVVSSPQPGHLYIINESPAASGRQSSFNILFPSPTANQGSAQLAAGQTISIPEIGDGFIFDEEQGTERLWLIWTADAVAELEAIKRWANPQDKGEIRDADQAGALSDLLTKHSTPAPDAQKDEATKQTTVKGRGEILVKLIKLEHH
ncbi:MAG: protein kinase domain-containing protein [Blastocatellia bacterium]